MLAVDCPFFSVVCLFVDFCSVAFFDSDLVAEGVCCAFFDCAVEAAATDWLVPDFCAVEVGFCAVVVAAGF